MRVPLLDLQLQYASIRSDIHSAIDRVCASQQFIMGPEVQQFEQEVAAAIGARHAIGVSSGTDALLVALMALGIGPGDEVVTPTFSFFATAGSVARLGARPVFTDVDPDTLMLTASGLQAAITERTRAVIPVDLYGLCVDMDPVAEVAAAARLHVVEDAAQALGAAYQGRQAGTLGTLGCFSFFPSKNLGAYGDAGLVTTDDGMLAARVRRLRNHGEAARYVHEEVGGNFRLDGLQAAVLRAKLPHLAAWNERRRANAALYRQLFTEAGIADRVRLPHEPPGRHHIYHQYVVRVPDRDRLRAHLADRGIGTAIYYPVPFHRQACFAGLTPPDRAFPNAEAAASEVLALPIYPELTRAQQEHVVGAMAEFLSQRCASS
jgi:dTDP-4-amino-4,6-dideoxygalactose transaminase